MRVSRTVVHTSGSVPVASLSQSVAYVVSQSHFLVKAFRMWWRQLRLYPRPSRVL